MQQACRERRNHPSTTCANWQIASVVRTVAQSPRSKMVDMGLAMNLKGDKMTSQTIRIMVAGKKTMARETAVTVTMVAGELAIDTGQPMDLVALFGTKMR